jgi:diguanylate cyclase (GGDEF)-like protein
LDVLSGFQSTLSEVRAVYTNTDTETAEQRAAHLSAILRVTPLAMIANVGSAATVVVAFQSRIPSGMLLWFAAVTLVSSLGVWGGWHRRKRELTRASPRSLQRATLHASMLASVWSIMPVLWFHDATGTQQLLIATLVTGMLGAGSFILTPAPRASLAYVVIYTVGALIALFRAGTLPFVSVAPLLALYPPIVVVSSFSNWRKASHLWQAQAKAQRQERMLTLLLEDFEEHADEALWETETSGTLSHISPRFAELLMIAETGPIEMVALFSRQSPEAGDTLHKLFAGGRAFRNTVLSLPRANAQLHLNVSGKPLLAEDGAIRGWRGVLADISGKVEAERKLWQLAHTDSLSGLSNRFHLREQLSDSLHRGGGGALLMLDLDHFKSVNDTQGHSAGDELLKEVAQRLRGCVRPGDLVARLGGDEFAILLEDSTQPSDPEALGQRVLKALETPTEHLGRQLRVAASAGIARFTADETDADQVLLRADAALYAAKEAGRGRVETYVANLGERNRRRATIESELRIALSQGRLNLYWQPKVEIGGWKLVGAEALMRWHHPELGHVSPSEFIAVAESTGLINELGAWALRQACQVAVGSLSGIVVSVNVSPLQFRDGNFSLLVEETLRELQMPAAQLELEITESIFLDERSSALDQLHQLRGMGVRIALDDFGTGYSSLAYLRRFPFDTLKIDRSFVCELTLRKDARAIVQMMSQLAATLGMRAVAEGVETLQELAAVAEAGCHEVQGYLVSAPVPIGDFLRLQREWKPVSPLTAQRELSN